MLLPENASFARSEKEHANYYEDPDHLFKNDAIKSLRWREETEEEMVSGLEDSQTCKGVVLDVYIQKDQRVGRDFLFRVLCHNIQRLQKLAGHPVSLAEKTALIIATVVTDMALTNVWKNKLSEGNIHKTHSTPSANVLSSLLSGQNLHLLEEYQPGKVTSHNASLEALLKDYSSYLSLEKGEGL